MKRAIWSPKADKTVAHGGRSLGNRQHPVGSHWQILVHERFFKWRVLSCQEYELPITEPVQCLQEATASALFRAEREPIHKSINDMVKRCQECADINFQVNEQDSASSNKKLLAYKLPLERSQGLIVWWLWCAIHQAHAVQGTVLQWVPGAMVLVSLLYSTSLLLRSGTYWLRFTGSLHQVIHNHLDVRPGDPPAGAHAAAKLLIDFACQGVGGLGEQISHDMEKCYADLLAVLNGWRFESRLVHYCKGPQCCPNGRPSTVKRVHQAVMKTILNVRPTVPQLSRWTKVAGCLDFFLAGLTCHALLLRLFIAAKMGCEVNAVNADADDAQRLREMRLQVDPESVFDSSHGFKALTGSRIRKAFDALSKPTTMPLLWILALALAPLRFVQKYLSASVRSVRVRAQASGHTRRPPVIDMANAATSPVVVALQFLSALLSFDGDATCPIFVVLRQLTVESGRLGGWSWNDVENNMRIGAKALIAPAVAIATLSWAAGGKG